MSAPPADSLRHFGPPPSLGEIEEMGRRAYDALPPAFIARCGPVAIRAEEFADPETLEEMGIEDPFELAGLYRGVPLTERGHDDPVGIDMVFLYRRPILDWWAEEEMEFEDLIRHLIVHEIGHHFGFSDEEMEAIETAAD
ncbi:putative Zn-dependent protease with MMP-like domain [Dongia mobilis]|uniref:Putative Zn-dependent protease with MMP-like domain n=1 Tax=Dongia mobilis TaxID=578943 RepID=A0A4R6WJ73_9PROT|nr:metallopeptidase family protein [Dongia mobilis]TDQ78570.1 putative Zn-dependent protease with MMP-like domain [Dongia mobilis]